MKLVFNDTDISGSVQFAGCIYTDCVSSRADNVEIRFADPNELWRIWVPKKGDLFEVSSGTLRSGKMYVTDCHALDHSFVLRGAATPPASLAAASESWENIRFSELVARLASQIGMSADCAGVPDTIFARVDRSAMTVPGLLSSLCLLNSFGLKAFDGKFIFINEKVHEQSSPVASFGSGQYSSPAFMTSDAGLMRESVVKHLGDDGKTILGRWEDVAISGGTIVQTIAVASQGEAQRYAKGLLRWANRNETTGSVTVDEATGLAAGNVVGINGFGGFSANYYIDRAVHDLVGRKVCLNLRQPIRGDY
jgi:hypothetical protein